MKAIFARTHFVNIFHQHDRFNQALCTLHHRLLPEDVVVVVFFLYWTGDPALVITTIHEVNTLIETSQYTPGSIVEDPLAFVKASLKAHLSAIDMKDVWPQIFHRRFRPHMILDNGVRKIYANGLLKQETVTDVQDKQVTFALGKIWKHLSILTAALSKQIASSKLYSCLYLCLHSALGKMDKHGEIEFHAKNLANAIEALLLPGSVNMESTSNGLGPGFRQMVHILCGLGKCDCILSKSYMAKVLDDMTAWMSVNWPWPVHPKRRHVQSIFCEMQKFLFYCLHGHPPASAGRQPVQITTASVQKLANKYLQDLQKSGQCHFGGLQPVASVAARDWVMASFSA